MTGDKVDKATMTYGNRDDMWVANKVRMLMRDDLDHEFVCVGARDRIMYLSQEVERLTAICDGYRGEVEELKQRHDFDAKRLRVLAKVAGCEEGVPDDATAVACAGTVLGMIRRNVEHIVSENQRLQSAIRGNREG